MKIVRKNPQSTPDGSPPRHPPWKLLVVDDEADVRRLTTLNLRGFQFAGRELEVIEADSMADAIEKLKAHPDIALALIDVVMETDDAGLRLVEYIRKDLGNAIVRLVIRTGQPGLAPESFVIDNFDIDDYKDKTELTAQRLYTTVRTGLKGFRDLQTIELNRMGLARILAVTPELYNLQLERLEEYFRGVLMQIVGICNLEQSSMISTIDGLVVTLEGQRIHIRAGTGEFEAKDPSNGRRNDIVDLCSRAVLNHDLPSSLRHGAMVVPLQVHSEVLGFVYLESRFDLSHNDRELIQVMANQCAAALDNLRLHHNLEEAYDESIDMLANVAEFKDSVTGSHIRRIQGYTARIAEAMGLSPEKAYEIARASRLHDVGKVGVPDVILGKPGKLTPEEYEQMKRHTRIGEAVLRRSPSLAVACEVAVSHHERWDGGGYPAGLAGAAIPLAARLVAVADVFDALMSCRSYKDAWTPAQAAEHIEAGRGTQFDPDIADAFLGLFRSGRLDDLIAAAVEDARREADKVAALQAFK